MVRSEGEKKGEETVRREAELTLESLKEEIQTLRGSLQTRASQEEVLQQRVRQPWWFDCISAPPWELVAVHTGG